MPFLSARWRNLIVINYVVEPVALIPYLPPGTELDTFEGKALMSVIAFLFEDNKLFGVIPTYPVRNFEELNLRFYVRRRVGDEVRRGVVFVKEVVPSALIAGTARILYNEPYEARPMRHDFAQFSDQLGGELSYSATVGAQTITVSATTSGDCRTLSAGTVEEFILEHYWGYTKRSDGSTSEYRVAHQPWSFWSAASTAITGDIAALYPASLRQYLARQPDSAFIARGSSVAVYAYQRFYPVCDPTAFPRSDVTGYLLYDGSCGFCSWWVPRLAQILSRAGFAIAPLQDAWVSRALALSPEEIIRHIRLVLSDGTTQTGADAYLFVMRRIRGLRSLGLLLSLPGLRWITWRAYEAFSRNRFIISGRKACKL